MKKYSERKENRKKEINENVRTINEEEFTGHHATKQMGQYGDIFVIPAPVGDALADLLGVEDGWSLTPVGVGNGKGGFASWNSGDRLTIFEDERDFESDGE